MSWEEKFTEQGSFRGVPFWVESHRYGGGRRLVVDEYPQRDLHGLQDNGRKTGKDQSLTCFVALDNVFDERDALGKALDAAGAGQLEHPYLGSLRVRIHDWDVEEDTEHPGFARFDVVYVLEGAAAFPGRSRTTGQQAADAADWTELAAQKTLAEKLGLEGYTSDEKAEVEGGVQEAVSRLDKVRGRAREAAETAREYSARIQQLALETADLIAEPYELAAQIVGAVNSAAAIATYPEDALKLYRHLEDFRITMPLPGVTPSRRAVEETLGAIEQAVRVAAVAGAVRSLSLYKFATRREAFAARRYWAWRIGELQKGATGETFRSLGALKAALMRDISTRAAGFPDTATVTLPRPVPSLLLANRLHGHENVAERAEEIVSRNNAPHAAFLPAGTALEVSVG
jgi:prophage DNA circulation protein